MGAHVRGLRALDRAIPWRSKPQRVWFWGCAGCLALYAAYAAALGRSALFTGAAASLGALLVFAAAACLCFALLVALSGLKGGARAPFARGQLHAGVFAAGSLGCGGILLVFLLADLPGGVSVDSAVQWTQAATGVYSNWHPVFHTLLLHLCALVWPQYAFAVAVQCAAYALAMGYLTATLQAWGARRWAVLAAALVLTAAPIVGNTMMYLWKDNAMTIGAVVLCAQAINLYLSRGAWLQKPRNAVAFGLTLAFTTLVRHNAVLFTLPLMLLALCTCRAQLRGALTALTVLVAALALVLGPLYTALGVTYPSNGVEESIGVPMTALSNIRKLNPNALPPEARALTDAMADDADWARYTPDIYNSIKFGQTRRAVANHTLGELLTVAARAAAADPATAFQAVNGVTNLVWGLDDEGAAEVRVRNSGDLPSAPRGTGRLQTLGTALKAVLTAPFALLPLSWATGNIGVTLLGMLALALRALRRNGTRALLLCLPVLLYDLGTMCVLCGPDARFFSFSPLLCGMGLFVLLRDPAPDADPTPAGAVEPV
ncbi:MAG: DUF6020 family protein [Candidatus Limiplasma sp.]|nr:DUF6020 family protein [Candidatus Limiplasma sp.]